MKKLHALVIASLLVVLAAAASFRSRGVAASDNAAPATLGNYADTVVQLGGNTTIAPDAAPTGATKITVSTSTDFHGKLEADATSGVVRVTNSHPALPLPTDFYTVTVTAFDSVGAGTTTTFKLTVTASAACNPLSFSAANNLATGDTPMAVAVGDFNRDGKQDLASANLNADNVSVMLGDGAGNFIGAVNFAAGNQPSAIAVGDFNGDGKQDLAVTNSGVGSVSILLGDGLGVFGAANNFAVGVLPFSVAVGDFDGDGRADLVVANENSHTLSVLMGDGAGSFAAANNLPVSGAPNAVVVGDFNGDGKQDIASSSVATNFVSIFLGDGAGGFSDPTNFVVGSVPRALALGDFNHDGKQDLVTANQGPDNLSVLTGDGTGNFTVVTGFSVGLNPDGVTVGDFNGDGNQDIAAANTGAADISVLLGDGTGSFSAASNFNVDPNPEGLAVGDFNGDGQEDLAVADTGSTNVSILLRQCAPPASLAVINTNDSGAGSLRQAILDANASVGSTQTITFNIPGVGVHTISPTSALPQITDPVIIDGTTQPGYAGVPLIEIDGSGAGPTTQGLLITAGASTVRALIINRFDGNGIELDTKGGNTIVGNYLGTNAAGTAAAGNHANGVAVGGTASNHIGGTTAADRNLVSGNGAHGIALFGNSTGNLVRGNYVGTNVTGTASVPNVGRGITVFDGTNNQIGGTTAGAGNVASGNGLDGIAIESTSAGTAAGNTIAGNFVGTNASGTGALGNAAIGVLIVSAANNTIGGATATSCNVISGNNSDGVRIGGADSFGTEISNNYIGTNAAGTAALGNGQHGVLVNIDANATQTVATIADDLISGNAGDGVRFVGSASTSTKSPTPHPVGGNGARNIRTTVGANVTGTAAIPNGGNGVSIVNAANILIGGDTAADRNLISGNAGNGVMISTDNTSSNNTIRNNYIGTNAAGTGALGNGQHGVALHIPVAPAGETLIANDLISGNVGDGVHVDGGTGTSTKSPTPHPQGRFIWIQACVIGASQDGTAAVPNARGVTLADVSNILIGGDNAAERNIISGNAGNGVEISGASSRNNQVTGNYIGTNASGDAALSNSLNGVFLNGLSSDPSVFAATLAGDLISGNGASGVYIKGSTSNVSGTTANLMQPAQVAKQGNDVLSCRIGVNAGGTAAIANGASGITIDNASDNLIGGTTAAERNMISGNTGNGVQISGADSTDNAVEGNYIGTDAAGTSAIANHGHGVLATGLQPGTTAPLLVMNDLVSGNVGDGVRFVGSAGALTKSPVPDPIGGIAGRNVRSTIGANAAGTAAIPNGGNGISIVNASNIVIGGDTAADRNLISGNTGHGIEISGPGSSNNQVTNNYIGIDATGTMALGNQHGILVHVPAHTNGTALEIRDDLISGNRGDGIRFEGVDKNRAGHAPASLRQRSSNNANSPHPDPNGSSWIAIGCPIGTGGGGAHSVANGNAAATSTDAIPNGGNGISIVDASNIQIGTTTAGDGNTIAYNNGIGILVMGDSTGNPIAGNSIFANAGGGIDINGDGPTANDPCDADTGPAGLQNYPLLTFAHGGGNTSITGSLNSTASASFTVDFFAGDSPSSDGGTYLGSTVVNTDATCNGSFNVTLPVAVTPGKFITATATDAGGNTSEFSAEVIASAPTATSASIGGRVTNVNGEPLGGVTVFLSGGALVAITDAEGNYRFDNLEAGGFYTVMPGLANYSFAPATRSLALLGNKTDAVFTAVPDATPTANPLDSEGFFVRQQYLDFLGREPDAGGWNYWTTQIAQCGGDATCIRARRIDVSAAFFMEQEFQASGAFIYDVYAGALGRRPMFGEYSLDRQTVVGGSNLESAKITFAQAFVTRPEFVAKYQTTITAESFVDALLQNASALGVDLFGERASLISLYNNNSSAAIDARAAVVRGLADNVSFKQAQYNRAFVTMEYFGYLRRDPDQEGYDFWLNVLNNREPNNYRGMVCSFVTAAEYQQRFSGIVTHSNGECR